MKKKALEFLKAASKGPLEGNRNLQAILGIGYALLALVEVCEEKK